MKKRNVKIWIWLYKGKIVKAVSCLEDGTLTIYDEHDNILIKRTGLTPVQIKKIENVLSISGAKQINKRGEPFTYL